MPPQFIELERLTQILTEVKKFVEKEISDIDIPEISATISSTSTNETAAGSLAVYTWVTNAISSIEKMHKEIVASLPTTGEENILYLAGVGTEPFTTYTMHAWIGGEWVNLGDTDIDLTNYWSKTELTAATEAEVQAILDSVFT
jgi:hypothetical protein